MSPSQASETCASASSATSACSGVIMRTGFEGVKKPIRAAVKCRPYRHVGPCQVYCMNRVRTGSDSDRVNKVSTGSDSDRVLLHEEIQQVCPVEATLVVVLIVIVVTTVPILIGVTIIPIPFNQDTPAL